MGRYDHLPRIKNSAPSKRFYDEHDFWRVCVGCEKVFATTRSNSEWSGDICGSCVNEVENTYNRCVLTRKVDEDDFNSKFTYFTSEFFIEEFSDAEDLKTIMRIRNVDRDMLPSHIREFLEEYDKQLEEEEEGVGSG